MKTSTIQSRVQVLSDPVRKLLLVVASLIASNVAQEATAEVQKLRERGRTLIEGENYSAASEESPYAEASQKCSGQKQLAYYWGGSWFELELDVPKMRNYTMSLRASSPFGTEIEVQMVDDSGNMASLANIVVPNTGSWTDYTDTERVTLSLPDGVTTLRFKNSLYGANIDYLTFAAGSDDDIVSAAPVANAGPDINPLKGWNSGWWRENEDYASVGFQYIEWGQFEPEDDKFDWKYVEQVLDRPGSKNRHVILQFVVDWDDWDAKNPNGESHYKGPKWLLDRVGQNEGLADPKDPKSRVTRATNYNDPAFIEEASEAIKTLLDHFKEDPRTFVIQVGVLGFWGEWHTFPREDWGPTRFTKFAILDAYMKNLGPDGLTQFRYPDDLPEARRRGMGYTNGSATTTDHGYEFGEAIAKDQLWKNGPVGGEWPPNVELKHWKSFFQTDEGDFFIKQARYSTLLPPESREIAQKLPDWKQDGRFMKMHRQLGYNFQAKAVRHLVSVDDSGQTHIEVDLHNVGIAPFYKNWEVQLAIIKTETAEVVDVIKIDTDLRKLGPTKSITFSGSSKTKLDPLVEYQIGLRILQPRADKTKTKAWSLNARNTYVVLANDVKVAEGKWNEKYALEGGWNILDDIQRRQPVQSQPLAGKFFPLEGSFRPAGGK